jgi:hypothetical protein
MRPRIWVDGLKYKLTILNLPSYLIKTVPSLNSRTFEASFQTATYTNRRTEAGAARGGVISPVLFSLYVKYIPSPFRHVKVALYAEDPAVIATSRQPAVLVKYRETYFSEGWRIAINVRRAPRRSSLTQEGESPNPDRINPSGNQSNSSIPFVI